MLWRNVALSDVSLAIDLEVLHESTQEMDCGQRDGLPKDGIATAFLVGDGIDLIDRRHIEGKSRWLPNNAIEITLKITELDNAKRTETILLEGFEPKTLLLREDPEHGRRDLPRRNR